MQKVNYILPLFFLLYSCNNENSTGNNKQPQQATTVISPERANPNSNAVAAFSENINTETGKLNNWKFAIVLYETHKTFVYRMEIQYAELHITDSLQLPDLDMEPKPVLQKGKDDYSCIIGFMDNKNIFREYKLVAVTNGNVRIHTLKYYGVQRAATIQ